MIAVVSCFFNWADFKAPARNLRRFLREMTRYGLPVYGLEYHMRGKRAHMKVEPNWTVQEVGEEAIMFQKEHMLNRVVSMLPKHFDKIFICDTDLQFERFDLEAAIEKAMESKLVIQPFEYAIMTDSFGAVAERKVSCCKSLLDAKWKAHPGFAWVIDRSYWDSGPGLYDKMVCGSGDTIAASCFTGSAVIKHLLEQGGSEHVLRHVERSIEWCKGKYGYIHGSVFHEYHGSKENRRYYQRREILAKFDPVSHLEIKNGVMVWTDRAPKAMRREMKNYFLQRKEDG